MVCLSIRRSLPNTCENDFNRPVLLLWPKGSLIIGVENEGASRIDGNRIDDALVVLARNDAGLTTLSIDKTNDSARRPRRTYAMGAFAKASRRFVVTAWNRRHSHTIDRAA